MTRKERGWYALFQQGDRPEALKEAAEQLMFANAKDPDHLATYRAIPQAGSTKATGVGAGMGQDLGPAMATSLETL